jgi:hypothetical protein
MTYVPLGKARYRVEPGAGGELILIPARKFVFAMLFLPVWLTAWTAGGIAAIYQVLTSFSAFLVLWLCFWAAGWAAAAGTLAWMAFGSETLRATGDDLEVAHHLLGWSRRKVYRGQEIRHLQPAPQPPWPFRFQWQMPLLTGDRMGAVKFDYGARTVHVAGGLDEAEGRAVAELLSVRLPRSARDG